MAAKDGKSVKDSSKQLHLSCSCPNCGSFNIIKSGRRSLSNERKAQVLKCLSCNHKFSKNYIKHQRQGRTIHYAQLEGEKMETATETKTVTGGIENKLREYHLNMSANLGGRDWEVDLTASSAGTCKSTASESDCSLTLGEDVPPRTPGAS